LGGSKARQEGRTEAAVAAPADFKSMKTRSTNLDAAAFWGGSRARQEGRTEAAVAAPADFKSMKTRGLQLTRDWAAGKLRDRLGFHSRDRFHLKFFLLHRLHYQFLDGHTDSPELARSDVGLSLSFYPDYVARHNTLYAPNKSFFLDLCGHRPATGRLHPCSDSYWSSQPPVPAIAAMNWRTVVAALAPTGGHRQVFVAPTNQNPGHKVEPGASRETRVPSFCGGRSMLRPYGSDHRHACQKSARTCRIQPCTFSAPYAEKVRQPQIQNPGHKVEPGPKVKPAHRSKHRAKFLWRAQHAAPLQIPRRRCTLGRVRSKHAKSKPRAQRQN
jgi:hypothetical protein